MQFAFHHLFFLWDSGRCSSQQFAATFEFATVPPYGFGRITVDLHWRAGAVDARCSIGGVVGFMILVVWWFG